MSVSMFGIAFNSFSRISTKFGTHIDGKLDQNIGWFERDQFTSLPLVLPPF